MKRPCPISRQHDYSNCPIFALRDAVALSRMEKVFEKFDFLNPNKEKPDSTHFLLNHIPSIFMKTSQSLPLIETYNEGTTDPDHIIHTNKSGVGETLNQNVARHTFTTAEGEKENWLIQQRFHKYLRIILEHLIEKNEK